MNDRSPEADPAAPVAAAADQQIIVARQAYPGSLPLLPLPIRPIFPKVVAPIAIDTPGAATLVQEVHASSSNVIGLVLQRSGEAGGSAAEPPREGAQREHGGVVSAEVHEVGVVAQILKAGRMEGTGTATLIVGGLDRFRIRRVLRREPYLLAEVQYLYQPKAAVTDELKAYGLAVINSVKDLIQLSPLFKEELNLLVAQGSFEDPGQLADLAAFLTSAPGEELQEILETLDVRERLEKVLGILKKELDISKLQTKIRQQLEERVTRQQREFFLREQLKAIKKELGLEKDDKESEIQRFLGRLEKKAPTEEAQERIEEEVEKLRVLEPASPEFSVTRNYLDWLTILPWGVTPKREVDLATARKVLDEDHHGLDDVKARILEFVAAGIVRGSFGGSIICLVGPPGVGKTSIGRSIAKSLGREFYRFSLGGMRDEAEIKGHRRTYIGAMPGKFIQAMRVCKTQDPVIMLDEIDKIGEGFRGDPASALLEALDPEQNREFLDHYLDVRFDLSSVLFVCTANQLDTIPPPLLDRMEVIRLSGYILEEKLEIARRYLIPREIRSLGLKPSQVSISTAAIREIIDGYAREAGLRGLERELKKVIRKSVLKLLSDGVQKVKVGPEDVPDLLGRRAFASDVLYERPRPGVVMGLAWTNHGGDTLFVEATRIRSSAPGFKQTGQLGKVMVESSEIAYTIVRARCAERPACAGFFDEHFIHLHVPAGATPKDGPSAGITMATALYSLARGVPVKPGCAMTGEINLSGHVMPVGGIKEKIIAAKRAKVKQVILPKANEADYERLPEPVKKGIRPHFVESFDEVVALCLR